MKPTHYVLFFVLFAFPALATQDIEDAFSPDQGATALVVKTIGEANKTIRVAAYSFTSEPIAEALVNAYQHGVDVKVVLDKSQRNAHGSQFSYLTENGVPTRINDHYHIMHDKFMLIDDDILETGSFNYTKSAEEDNAENVLVIHSNSKVDKDYASQWKKLWDEAVQ